jgi:acyl-coenzyme A thioesterase 9
MEVVVKMESLDAATQIWSTMMLGRFAMVCRDSKTQKARKVPGLVIDTDEEWLLWKIGESMCSLLLGEVHEVS